MPTPYAVCPLSFLEEVSRLGAKYKAGPKRRRGKKDVDPVDDKRSSVERGVPTTAEAGGWEFSYRHRSTGDTVKVGANPKGRMMLTAGTREIVVLRTERSSSTPIGSGSSATENHDGLQQKGWSLFAFDRHCYHVGYPLDLGDLEEHPRPRPSGDSCDELAATDFYQCINCPLHNRIFDLETGDMLALDQDAKASSCGSYQRIHEWRIMPLGSLVKSDSGEDEKVDNTDDSEKYRCLESSHQRCKAGMLHPQLEKSGNPNNWLETDPWIVVLDSHGESNPLVMTSAKNSSPRGTFKRRKDSGVLETVGTATDSEETVVVYIPNQKVASDSYNRKDGIQLEWVAEKDDGLTEASEEPTRKKTRTE